MYSGALSSPSTTSKVSDWAMTTGIHVCAHAHAHESAPDLKPQMWRSVYMRLHSFRRNTTTVIQL